MLMIVPDLAACMSPITTLVAFKVPFRLTSISWLKASGSTSVKARASAMPALLMRQAVLPNFCSAPRMARSRPGEAAASAWAYSVQSAGNPSTGFMCRAISSSALPSWVKARATARPMPELAPVMTTRGPGKESLLLALVGDGGLHERDPLGCVPVGVAFDPAELAAGGIDQDRCRQQRDVEHRHRLAAPVVIDAEGGEVLLLVEGRDLGLGWSVERDRQHDEPVPGPGCPRAAAA